MLYEGNIKHERANKKYNNRHSTELFYFVLYQHCLHRAYDFSLRRK